uniref:Uncharacterized protein n=1 Tax=Anguilla anguilla TaxID=7936 RepID=A0A0E9UCM2_ANGAN
MSSTVGRTEKPDPDISTHRFPTDEESTGSLQ